jgi:hypothetical protein
MNHSWLRSTFYPLADIEPQSPNVRFVLEADIPRCGRDWRYSITSSADDLQRQFTSSNFIGCSLNRALAWHKFKEVGLLEYFALSGGLQKIHSPRFSQAFNTITRDIQKIELAIKEIS